MSGGSNQNEGFMGAGYGSQRKKSQQGNVGRDVEGSSSNYLELAAFVLALCGTHVTSPMLYVYDNQVLLKALKKIGR